MHYSITPAQLPSTSSPQASSSTVVKPSEMLLIAPSLLKRDPAPSCLVCGEQVLYHNFGTLTCNGCAAFFRRSILQSKAYTCRQSRDCNIYMSRHKRRCPYCRFERCVKVGMNVSKLMTRLTRDNENPLKQLLKCHRGIASARTRNAIVQLGNLADFERMCNQPRTSQSATRASMIEAAVLKEFLRSSGLIAPDLFDCNQEQQVCATLLLTWEVLQSVFTTKLFGGQHANKVYNSDGSFLKATAAATTDFFSTDPNIVDAQSVAISALPYFQQVLETASLADRLALDEHEVVVLTMLVLVRVVMSRFGVNALTREWQNRLLRDLHAFHKTACADIPERMGEIMLCLESLEAADRYCDMLAVVAQLNCRRTDRLSYKLFVRGHPDLAF